jgi:hypothetical protein
MTAQRPWNGARRAWLLLALVLAAIPAIALGQDVQPQGHDLAATAPAMGATAGAPDERRITDAQPPQADAAVAAASPDSPDSPRVQLATIDPGELYWQRFGHNTLVVAQGPASAVSYNFGYFDFEQPDFLTRFLLGRMLYQALALPAGEDFAGYVDEGRSVHLQSLALTRSQAQRLDALLRESVRPENRDYRYDYFTANCSTRLRDALDAALDGNLRRQTAGRSRGSTFRSHAMRLAQGNFWLATGIDLGLGPFTDRRLSFWDEMFIPEMMRRVLRSIDNGGTPLVAEESTWYDSGAPLPPEAARDVRVAYLLVGLAIAALLLFATSRAQDSGGARRAVIVTAATLQLLFGLAGALLLFLWLGTDHTAAHRNENILLLNPLGLGLAVLWLLRLRRPGGRAASVVAAIVAAGAVLGLLAKTLPDLFVQANLHWCLLLVPIQLALWRAWLRLPDRPAAPLSARA